MGKMEGGGGGGKQELSQEAGGGGETRENRNGGGKGGGGERVIQVMHTHTPTITFTTAQRSFNTTLYTTIYTQLSGANTTPYVAQWS